MITHQMVISIGNSDNKLTQKEWSSFVAEVGRLLASNDKVKSVWFNGFSPSDAPWQNAAWWVEVDGADIPYFREKLGGIRKSYQQDSVAMIIADETEMV